MASNIANPASIASLEYAISVLKVPLILVLGHESCGAVEAALKGYQERLDYGYNLNQLISFIVPAINGECPENNLTKAIQKNAELTAKSLVAQSTILQEAVGKEIACCLTSQTSKYAVRTCGFSSNWSPVPSGVTEPLSRIYPRSMMGSTGRAYCSAK